YLLISIAGYAWPLLSATPGSWSARITASTIMVSIMEPVSSAWIAMLLAVLTVYPARRAAAMPYMLWASLLLFCVPAAVYAIGWIDAGQAFGGLVISPIVAYTSRAVPLCVLGFAIGYSKLPESLENAARLVCMPAVYRASALVLPLFAASLIAASALA